MAPDDITAQYVKALKLPPRSLDARMAALNRAHELRKFEIENYWKRAAYFWSFQAIAFAVLGLMFDKGGPPEPIEIIMVPAAIGAISGFIGWLSAKGSKYWQENWEAHVDMLEDDIEGRLTQVIWSKGKRSHSVSKLNQAFMGCIVLAWMASMVIVCCEPIRGFLTEFPPLLAFIAILILLFCIWICTRQDFSGQIFRPAVLCEKEPLGEWSWKALGAGSNNRKLLLRDSKAKRAEPPK